ncbi:hypothetical protein TNCV_1637221 [Trichonephila clavipes]|nr:hypothetical protein TNCV_1637221 [Trichonephila clavipes]
MWCHGSILGVTVYCRQWHPVTSHELWERFVAVKQNKKKRFEEFITGSLPTSTIVITAEIEYGFLAKDDLVPFHCSPVSSCVTPHQTKSSMGGRQGQHT